MIITKKKIFIGAAIAVGAVSFLGISYLAKKKNNNQDEDIEDIYDPEIIDDIVEVDEGETSEDIYVDEEETENNTDENTVADVQIEDDVKYLRCKLIAYLAKHGVDQDTIMTICKTELDILDEIPEEYYKVRNLYKDVICSQYSPELVDDLFNSIFKLLYMTMDPHVVFNEYKNKTERMGDSYQFDIINLVEALDVEIDKENPEAVNAFAELYNFIKLTPEEDFNEATYEKIFKQFVDKFVRNNEVIPETTITAAEVVDEVIEESNNN